VPYSPEQDIEGIDLVVKRRWKEGTLSLQVKTRAYHDKMGNLTIAVDEGDLPAGDPKLIVVLEYFPRRAKFGPLLWVIPDDEFRANSKLTRGKFEATLSPKTNARDRWVDYRYNERDLPWVIGEHMGRRAGAKALARPRPSER
jgi:hypothetical protein